MCLYLELESTTGSHLVRPPLYLQAGLPPDPDPPELTTTEVLDLDMIMGKDESGRKKFRLVLPYFYIYPPVSIFTEKYENRTESENGCIPPILVRIYKIRKIFRHTYILSCSSTSISALHRFKHRKYEALIILRKNSLRKRVYSVIFKVR